MAISAGELAPAPDPPVHLSLKGVLDQTYDLADYGKYIYEETPEPSLAVEDEAWAKGLIAHAAR